jgi:hypothetical protein
MEAINTCFLFGGDTINKINLFVHLVSTRYRYKDLKEEQLVIKLLILHASANVILEERVIGIIVLIGISWSFHSFRPSPITLPSTDNNLDLKKKQCMSNLHLGQPGHRKIMSHERTVVCKGKGFDSLRLWCIRASYIVYMLDSD